MQTECFKQINLFKFYCHANLEQTVLQSLQTSLPNYLGSKELVIVVIC